MLQDVEYLQQFTVDWDFDAMIDSANNAALIKYIVQNGRILFSAILESTGNFVMVPYQNSLNNFFKVFFFKQNSSQGLKQHFLWIVWWFEWQWPP